MLSFIEAVREKPVLWDPKDAFKKNKAKRGDAFSPATEEDLAAKWKNLKQTYRNAKKENYRTPRSQGPEKEISIHHGSLTVQWIHFCLYNIMVRLQFN